MRRVKIQVLYHATFDRFRYIHSDPVGQWTVMNGYTTAGRHEKKGGVKVRDRSAEELDRETGE